MTKLAPSGMRQPLFPRGPRVTIDFEGQPIDAHTNEPLAVALLAAGVKVLGRSIKFHRPRGIFCLAGDCGACLMRVDGRPNVRACRTAVHQHLHCERQNAWPSASFDVLAAADVLFPDGMDHHGMFTWPRPLNEAMQAVVRQMGGLGRLPDATATPAWSELPPRCSRHVALAVVGAGPAGLAAATAAARAGVHPVLIVDAAPVPGGSYLSHPQFGPVAAQQAAAEAQAAGAEIWSSAEAIGYYPEDVADAAPDRRAGVLAVATPTGMQRLSADSYLYATGGHEQNALFGNNDRPGVLAGRAVGLLLTTYGILPGRRPLVVGDGEYADALHAALTRAGAQVERIDGQRERPHRACGNTWVTGVDIESAPGVLRHLLCDLVAVVLPPAPASELPQLHGARVEFADNSGFAVIAGDEGATSCPHVFACGEVVRPMGVSAAQQHGRRGGLAIAAARSGGFDVR